MGRRLLAVFILLFSIVQAYAQIGAMKMVGNNTSDYSLGFGAFIKGGFPVLEGSDATIEIGANIFLLDDGDGTAMCPLKVGFRYTFDGTGSGLYVEPQVGYNLYGVTSLHDENGQQVNLKYHGVVFAAGGGYLFNIGRAPFDVNFRYETVIAHGGSNNFISLGITRYFRFGKRDSDY